MKHAKPNNVPVAPFNLRDMGPMKPSELSEKLGGAEYRTGANPTLDKDPCPFCHARVEWHPTSHKEGTQVVRYIYARCSGAAAHTWGFRDIRPTPPKMPFSPRDLSAPDLMRWVEDQLIELAKEAEKLKQIKALAEGIKPRVPRPSASA